MRSGQEKRTKVCDDEACIIMPDRSWSARPATVVPRSGYSCPAGACSAVCRGPIRKSTRTQNLFFISGSVDLFFFFFYLPGVVLLVGARVVCSLWWWWSVRSTFPPSHFLLALQNIAENLMASTLQVHHFSHTTTTMKVNRTCRHVGHDRFLTIFGG